MRELVAQARQMLQQPLPDTFAGRKTQEPFPLADTDEPAPQWPAGGGVIWKRLKSEAASVRPDEFEKYNLPAAMQTAPVRAAG